ncbi:MAG: hypothetical protein GTO40_03175, partial [Deltaproteobacteria bacterium]|nr:hypothetical protein [Deltaproteobacteria bacterium]
MKRYGFYLLGSTLLILLLFGGPWSAQAQAPEVHAVLFYSQTCPYCHQVMQVDLPPLLEAYGDQLKILT